MAAPSKTVTFLKMPGIMRILPSLKNKINLSKCVLKKNSVPTAIATQNAYDSFLQSLRRVLDFDNQSISPGVGWQPKLTSPFLHSVGGRQTVHTDTTECESAKHLLCMRSPQGHSSHALCRRFSTSRPSLDGSNDGDRDPSSNPLRLMNFTERIWPHPIKSLRNLLMCFLISGYMEKNFTMKRFLDGAEQAVTLVSRLISMGKFDELDGLVAKDAIHEIRQHYNILDSKQKEMLAVDPRDVFYRFVYEIGMIFDDQTEKRFVEITAVFQGYHGLAAMKDRGEQTSYFHPNVEEAGDMVYVCNYRFVREYTKGLGESTDWTINKVNHFCPKDIVKETGFFNR